MAGVLPGLPLAQQFDIDGTPLAGALLYIFEVGTTATPQNAYQDFGLSIALPNPISADQTGRLPMFYLADGQVHIRLTDASGVVIFDYPTVQVVGPSSGSGGGGGGGGVDPTALASTGDMKFRPTTETLTGWVKMNALTIGSATSGATQRANADTQNLFVYLWSNFTNTRCPVTGGRGATALADFQANKQIALPDWRARGPVGLDDMGNTAAGIIQASNVTSGGGDGPTTAAAYGGEANHTLITAEMPSHTHGVTDPGHTHSVTVPAKDNGTYGSGYSETSPITTPTSYTAANSTTGISINNIGGSTAHNTMQPFVLGTWFMKL